MCVELHYRYSYFYIQSQYYVILKSFDVVFVVVHNLRNGSISAMVLMMRCAIVLMPEQFVANRPFLVAIIVENTPYFVASYRGS